jgi:hypothetical protein
MEVIMVPYRHQNKKAFLVDRISSYRHTLCPSDITSELSRQSDEPHLLKACLGLAELQLAAASRQSLPASVAYSTFLVLHFLNIVVEQFKWGGSRPSQIKAPWAVNNSKWPDAAVVSEGYCGQRPTS